MADGTAICPECDHIIDASFLEQAPPPDAEEGSGSTPAQGTVISPPPSAPPPKRANRPSRPARAPRAERAPPLAARTKEVPQAPVSLPPPPLQRRVADEGDGPLGGTEQIEAARRFVSDLRGADQLAFWGGVVAVLCSFLPWKETAAEGEILGAMSVGIVSLVASVILVGAIVLRVRELVPSLRGVPLWVAQLGAGAFSLFWCIVYAKASSDPTLAQSITGNVQVPVSKPALGLYLTMIGLVVALVGTVLGLKEQRT